MDLKLVELVNVYMTKAKTQRDFQEWELNKLCIFAQIFCPSSFV